MILTDILQITKIGVNATILLGYQEAEMARLSGCRGRLLHRATTDFDQRRVADAASPYNRLLPHHMSDIFVTSCCRT